MSADDFVAVIIYKKNTVGAMYDELSRITLARHLSQFKIPMARNTMNSQ